VHVFDILMPLSIFPLLIKLLVV